MLIVGIFRGGWSFVNLILVTNIVKYKYPSMEANALPSFLEQEKDVSYFRAGQLIGLLKEQFVCSLHCTMLPLSTKSCLKLNKLRPILNG